MTRWLAIHGKSLAEIGSCEAPDLLAAKGELAFVLRLAPPTSFVVSEVSWQLSIIRPRVMGRLCATCRTQPAADGQSYCSPCKSAYMREWLARVARENRADAQRSA